MKKFMLLHFGFEKPTPEVMAAWGRWFASIADRQLGQGGFRGGREAPLLDPRENHRVDGIPRPAGFFNAR